MRRIEPYFHSWLVPQIAGAKIHLTKTVNVRLEQMMPGD